MSILSNIKEYTKRTWKNGKIGKTAVSAAPMNNIEEGIYLNRELIKALNANNPIRSIDFLDNGYVLIGRSDESAMEYKDTGFAPIAKTIPTQYLRPIDLDTIYDTGLYGINSGENCPSGSPYGVLLVMSYRKQSGNTYPDFCVQIFMPNGDDPTDANTLFYRTSTTNSWNEWRKV